MSDRAFNDHYEGCICNVCCQKRRAAIGDAAPQKSEVKSDPLKDPLYVQLMTRREHHLAEALKFGHLSNLVYESASMSPHSRQALRNLLEASLAHI